MLCTAHLKPCIVIVSLYVCVCIHADFSDKGPVAALAPKPQTASIPSNGCKIKGNINAKGDKIYHMPGSQYYESTQIDTPQGERWFCTEQQAKDAGWRGAQ